MSPNEAVKLADEMAAFEGVSHWAISQRIFGKGNYFECLRQGRSANYSTLERASRWFASNWPEDLPWPDGIDRPDVHLDADRHERSQAVA